MNISPFAVGKVLSTLLDRPVQISLTEEPDFSDKTLIATYELEPSYQPALIKMDLAMLATLAGTMIALPVKQIDEQVKKGTLDENMLDAAREVMNILSSVFAEEGRAVFRQLASKESELSSDARYLLACVGENQLSFRGVIAAQTSGFMTVLCTPQN